MRQAWKPSIAAASPERHGRLMRFILGASLAVLLAACASSPPPVATPSGPPAAPATAPTASGPVNILTNAGGPNAPAMDQVVRALGAADITRHDGAGVALTYRLDHCALLLLFTADTRNVMRLAEADATPRRASDPAPTLDQCVTEAHARPAVQRR